MSTVEAGVCRSTGAEEEPEQMPVERASPTWREKQQNDLKVSQLIRLKAEGQVILAIHHSLP